MLNSRCNSCTTYFKNLSTGISLIAMGCCLPLLLLQLLEQRSHELGMVQKAAFLFFATTAYQLTGPVPQHITPYHDAGNHCCSACVSVSLRKQSLS